MFHHIIFVLAGHCKELKQNIFLILLKPY